jgi:membrane protease YdiL (CAAX protease family)
MNAVAIQASLTGAQRPHATILKQALVAAVCLLAGFAALAPRWLTDDVLKVGIGVLLAAAYLGFALVAKRSTSLNSYWPLAFAFFVFAFVQVLNNSLPGFVGTYVLRDPPNAGNPFASTIGGTVIVQLLSAAIAVLPIILLLKVSGSDLGSIFVRKGIFGKWLLLAVGFFVAFYIFTATIPLRPGSYAERLLPTNGPLSIAGFLALSPALIVMSLSNGLEEELLFRGLFLQKYTLFFGAVWANVLQAAIFSFAHLGVTYTPSAILFVAVIVFPLALASGYLMRATNSVLVPTIFHGALDMAIYLTFLTYAS